METLPALLALGAGNSPVTGEFPSQRPVTQSFDVLFDLRLNYRWSKQSERRWFEAPSRPLWRHFNVKWTRLQRISLKYLHLVLSVYEWLIINHYGYKNCRLGPQPLLLTFHMWTPPSCKINFQPINESTGENRWPILASSPNSTSSTNLASRMFTKLQFELRCGAFFTRIQSPGR